LSIKDDVIRIGTIVKGLGYSTWLILDMLQWVRIDLLIMNFV